MQKERTARLIQGSDAIVEGAIAAGVRFFGAYPITPSLEITEAFSRRLPEVGGTFIQMEDEIASLAAVMGASVGGVKAMTATSGPGFSLMVENIGHAIISEIPCVIVDVQRMGPSHGMIYLSQGDMMAVKWATPGGNEVIALAPSSIKECFELTGKAVNLSERFRVPVFLVTDAYMVHMREKFEVPDPDQIRIVERPRPIVPPENYLCKDADATSAPPMADFGSPYRTKLIGSLHTKAGDYGPPPEERVFLVHRLRDKILAHLDEILMIEETMLEDAKIAVFAYGITARSAKAAVRAARAQGIKVGLMRPLTVWPFPKEAVAKLTERVDKIVVVELNLGQLVREVECASAGKAKVTLLSQVDGLLITPQKIVDCIKEGLLNA
jgi:2-oxoglutarate ferredoxin oxidoreductase subunit alpha